MRGPKSYAASFERLYLVGKVYACFDEQLMEFITPPQLFFVATAPLVRDRSNQPFAQGARSVRAIDLTAYLVCMKGTLTHRLKVVACACAI